MFVCFRAFVFSISQVLVGSAPLKPYGFDEGCKHTYIYVSDSPKGGTPGTSASGR